MAGVDDTRRRAPSSVYPNPFAHTARVEFILPREARIEMEVFDLLGRRMDVHFDRWYGGGRHVENIDCRHLAPGVYFYYLRGRDTVSAKEECASSGKFMILR